MNKFRLWLLTLSFCLSYQIIAEETAPEAVHKSCRIQIASLNVENLHPTFATVPDNTKEFMPLEKLPDLDSRPLAGSANRRYPNWTPHKLKLKLQQIKKIVDKMPVKPDILGTVEVREGTGMAKLGQTLAYEEPLVTSSTNERGMDVGALVNPNENLQILETREVPLVGPEFEWHKTRNLYVVTVKIAKRFILHFIEVHWPSQGGPTVSRIQAARQTRNLVDQLVSDYPGSEAIVTGDFNTLDDEMDHRGKHPFTDILLEPQGAATLVDVFDLHQFHAPIAQPPGTYFYPPKDQWNRLDRFFVTEGLLDSEKTEGLSIVPESFAIHAPKDITVPYKRPSGEIIDMPRKYNFEAETAENAGFTDHFAIYMTLQAKWSEHNIPESVYELDSDIFTLKSVVLYPKVGKGARRFLSWAEYQQEKANIGVSGKYQNYEFNEGMSFNRLKDLSDGRNSPFADLNYQMDRDADPDSWKGPKWEELVEKLSDPDTARAVVIEIPAHRAHRPETIYQAFLRLYDLNLIQYMPLLENIRAKVVPVTETPAAAPATEAGDPTATEE